MYVLMKYRLGKVIAFIEYSGQFICQYNKYIYYICLETVKYYNDNHLLFIRMEY